MCLKYVFVAKSLYLYTTSRLIINDPNSLYWYLSRCQVSISQNLCSTGYLCLFLSHKCCSALFKSLLPVETGVSQSTFSTCLAIYTTCWSCLSPTSQYSFIKRRCWYAGGLISKFIFRILFWVILNRTFKHYRFIVKPYDDVTYWTIWGSKYVSNNRTFKGSIKLFVLKVYTKNLCLPRRYFFEWKKTKVASVLLL